ncbi:MAG TPA: T9SS type A sorting domain-containing protein [Bacteroidia bacterium]|nr:T9SS type A sorting domain-containing protein [Bacteroidia bacterium]
MKKIIALTASIIFYHTVFSQTPAIQWQKSLAGTSCDYGNYVRQTSDGGYIVAGKAGSNDGDVTGNHGGYDYWVVKLYSTGILQWQKSLGGTGYDEARSVQQTADGGYIVAGSSQSIDGDVTGNHGSIDYWLVKLDGFGNIQWQKALGGTANDDAYSVQQTSDGGYIVLGYSYSNDGDVTGNHGGWDYWLVKVDGTGTIQWQKTLGGTMNDWAYSIEQTSDGGYIVAGSSQSNDGDVTGHHGTASSFDYWLVKLDPAGSIQWQKSLGGSSFDWAHSIKQTTDGGYIAAGYSSSNDGDVTGNHSYDDYWVVKLDNSGTILWQKSFGGIANDRAYSVNQTSDGGYIIAGNSSSNDGDVTGNHGGYEYWIVKLDDNGTLLWQKSMGGTAHDFAYSVMHTSDGGYIVAGESASNDGDVTGNHGANDYWIAKLYFDSPKSINENNLLSAMYLSPNPATTELRITNAEFKIEKVEIIDVLGQKYNSAFDILNSELTIDISSLASGIYFVKVRGEKEERVGKFVKL